MLAVERQSRRTRRSAPQRVQIGVRPDDDVRCDLRRRFVGRGGQHAKRLTKGDRGLMRHPGQLAATDHGDDGGSTHGAMLSRRMPARRPPRPARVRVGCLVSVDSPLVSFTDATIARLPRVIRPFAERHHELIKFAIVGGTTFIIDSAIFFTLKLTILEPKPVTAKIIAGVVAVIASYILNREWSFRDRGGR